MIPPGGEGQIQVTLEPKGGHTEITKNIVVHSNDPEQPQFTLTMKGTLLIDMVAQPPAVSLFNLAPGESGSSTVSVQRSEGSTATVKSIRIEDTDHFSIREVDPEPGALATYEVRFAGRDEVGTSATNLIVETTGDNTPELTIPVRANAAFNLRYPKRVGFIRSETGPVERTLRISTRRGDPPKIRKVEDPDGLLDIEVQKAEGPIVSIHLQVREDALDQIGEGVMHQLVVHTDDPDEPKLNLEYQMSAPRVTKRPPPKGR